MYQNLLQHIDSDAHFNKVQQSKRQTSMLDFVTVAREHPPLKLKDFVSPQRATLCTGFNNLMLLRCKEVEDIVKDVHRFSFDGMFEASGFKRISEVRTLHKVE